MFCVNSATNLVNCELLTNSLLPITINASKYNLFLTDHCIGGGVENGVQLSRESKNFKFGLILIYLGFWLSKNLEIYWKHRSGFYLLSVKVSKTFNKPKARKSRFKWPESEIQKWRVAHLTHLHQSAQKLTKEILSSASTSSRLAADNCFTAVLSITASNRVNNFIV